jgi:FkbM family methyltransferase
MIKHQGVYLPDGEKHLLGWMDKAGEQVDGKGSYQIKKLRAALEHVKQFRVAVDIGAHCGLWSMQLAKRFEQIVAFEPVERHRECFLANLQGHENVELHGCGLGEKFGFVTIESKPDSSGDSRVAAYADELAENGPRIPVKTLDSFDLPVVDFIKIDTEGYELFVVRGAEQTIKRCRPTMIVEQKGHGMQYFGFRKEEAVELLESWGMKRATNMSGDWVMVWQ